MTPDDLDPTDAFVPLEPPPGGWSALRARLAREGARPPRRWPRSFALFALGIAGAVLLVRREPAPRPALLMAGASAEDYPRLAARGLAPLPAEPVTWLSAPGAGAVRLQRVPVASPGIVFYLAGADHRAGPR